MRVKINDQTYTLMAFLVQELIFDEKYAGYNRTINVEKPLQQQPTEVVKCLGRLLELLIEKEIISKTEFQYITGSYKEFEIIGGS